MADDVLSATLAALADPTRRALLARLADGEATVNELAEPFPITLQAISKHLKVLEGAGLISRGRAAQTRPCRLNAAPLAQAAGWLEAYRPFWDSSFDRLDDHLRESPTEGKEAMTNTATSTDNDLRITRVCDAPRELVYAAWTEPEQIAAWMGPVGFTAHSVTGDPVPGGHFRSAIHNEQYGDVWSSGSYREVVAPERLVFTWGWEEPAGTPGLQTLVTITFTERDGKTEMTFLQQGLADAESRDGHEGGWTESFEKLAAYLQRNLGV